VANKYRGHMPRADRAKQFMPFAAVKGLEEALVRKEKEFLRVPKAELSEDMAARLDRTLRRLIPGMSIAVTYYDDGQYITIDGRFHKLDPISQTLYLDDASLPLPDISHISILPQT